MNEPQPPPENPVAIKPGEPPAAAQPPVYQPMSGWAIAGFGIGALFAGLVAVSTAVALVQGAPMFFPVWILVLAVAGIVLSLVGQRQIELAEGTRAGARLARWGVWLSLLSGLGYLSYYYVTGLALQNQANAFLMEKGEDAGFFPRLREGATNPAQTNAAYLLTLPSNARAGRPDDELGMIQLHDQPGKDGTPGPLTQFREGTFPRLFYKDLAKDVEITPLGVQDWKYEMRSYKIYRNYRIKTKEIELEVQLAVFSTEAEGAGKDRKWFVNMRESGPHYKTVVRTPLGEGVKLLRHLSDLWLRREVLTLNEGTAYPEIKDLDQSNWGLHGGPRDPVYVRDGDRDQVRALLHKILASDAKNRIKQFSVLQGAEEVGKWELIGGKVRIIHNFRFSFEKDPLGRSPYNVTGYAILDTKQPIDPAKFDKQSTPLPEWDIVAYVFTQVTPVMLAKAGPQ